MKRYPLERLYEEIAYIAFYFHWPYSEILEMDHKERQIWCREISKIINIINKTEGEEEKINLTEAG
jgi:hypothetical protein